MRWQLWCVNFATVTVDKPEGEPCPWATYWLRSTAERKARIFNAANMATNGLYYFVREVSW